LEIKIAFDAKRLFHNFTGLGNYSRSLVETFAKYEPDWQLQLYTPRLGKTPRTDFLAQYPQIEIFTPDGFWKNVPAVWRSFWAAKVAARHGAQIFHGLSHELPVFLPSKIKTVVTIHDLIFERFPEFHRPIDRLIYRQKFRSACRRADKIVAISQQTERDIIDFYHIEPERIQVIYQSCHRQFYTLWDEKRKETVRQKYQLPSAYLLYIGTINERKNLMGVVKAMSQMSHDLPLVVVGDGGAYLRKVQAFVAQNGLQNRFLLYPKLDFSDMPAVYQMASMLVFPSFFEGFGLPIIEALHSAIPVVTSVDSCFAEAGGTFSRYIHPNDSTEIANAVDNILNDSMLRKQMITNGLAHVEQFKEENLFAQWAKLYAYLL
jgi:glycosyltransferase involved in cell wall biosynthesis